MNLRKTQSDEILDRMRTANEGFMPTCISGKFYSDNEMSIKSHWVKKIERAKKDWINWYNSIPRAT